MHVHTWQSDHWFWKLACLLPGQSGIYIGWDSPTY